MTSEGFGAERGIALRFEVSHPFAGKKAKGWGTGANCGYEIDFTWGFTAA
jgi:hypothetical protein